MEEKDMLSYLHQACSDRRNLIHFILSSNLVKGIHPPPPSEELPEGVNLDEISADYVLECAREGRVLDLHEASQRYHRELNLPIMVDPNLGTRFFFVTDPETSTSPPTRKPPKPVGDLPSCTSSKFPDTSYGDDFLVDDEFDVHDEEDVERNSLLLDPPNASHDTLSIGLPPLHTDLSDDDLRETAYEVLLASLLRVGYDVNLAARTHQVIGDKKEEKKSRIPFRRKKKHDKLVPLSPPVDRRHEILDVIRVQMEISEKSDKSIWKALIQSSSLKEPSAMDACNVSLEILSYVLESGYAIDKVHIYWLKRQVNILEEVLCSTTSMLPGNQKAELKRFIAMLRNKKVRTSTGVSQEQAEVLSAVKEFVKEFTHTPKQFDIPGESHAWVAGYHLNLRLYEKLLSSIFDILDPGQLVKEYQDILQLIRSTWPILGISNRVHVEMYGWLLFRQFIDTGESTFLELAVAEMEKLPRRHHDAMEEAYLTCLLCSVETPDCKKAMTFSHTIITSIRKWCDSRLSDYHLYFEKFPGNFERFLTSATIAEKLIAFDFDETKATTGCMENSYSASKVVKMYVTSSTGAACERVLNGIETKLKEENLHPLAVLANELKTLAEIEYTTFSPTLCRWFPESKETFALLVHEFYGERLKPFCTGLVQLTEDARSVLPAANMLEKYLIQHVDPGYYSVKDSPWLPYQVGTVSYPLIQDWIDSQNAIVVQWAERASHVEVWEPLTSSQRCAASAVEVFRIVEETVDQFFGLHLPVDIMHIQALISVIIKGLETYLHQVPEQLVEKSNIFPSAPALTRYKDAPKTTFVKKKLVESKVLDVKVRGKLNNLTISKLCVQLNTLNYIGDQIRTLEESIRKHWTQIGKLENQLESSPSHLSHVKKIEEPLTAFDHLRGIATDEKNKICEFVGTKVVFWDLRESFLSSLYRCSVEIARLETVLHQLDTVLDNICDIIVKPMRDPVVQSIFRASLDGFLWVLLNGGPSRSFSETDVDMLNEDLDILMDFFIANGEGLPRTLVEKEARFVKQIISLYSLPTEVIIERLVCMSNEISSKPNGGQPGGRSVDDSNTLLRVLCHKKDTTASKFLKKHYNLPRSSDYEEGLPAKGHRFSSLLKHGTSFKWSDQNSPIKMRLPKMKFQSRTP